MLITIYNNDNKHSFQTDFKSNLILPVNTELKLTNAYIALSHEITIPELTIVLSANGSVPFTDNVVVPAGTYSLQSLADTITNSAQIVADNNNMSLKIDMTYDSKKGYSSGCFKLDVEALSTLANIFQALDISQADYNDFVASIDTTLLSSADVEKFIDSGVSYLGVTGILDKATPPIAVATWAYILTNETLDFKYWLRKNTGGGSSIQPPVSTDGAGCFTFQDNGNDENYYVGLQNKAVTFANITTNDFIEITNIDNTPVFAVVIKTTNGTYLTGEVVLFENVAGSATNTEVGRLTALNSPSLFPFTDNDQIGIVCNGGAKAEYFIKKSGSVWKSIPVQHSASRHVFDTSVKLYVVASIYGDNSSSTFQDASIKNILGSIVGSDFENKTDKFGQFVSWDWGTSGTGPTDSNLLLGFTDKVSTKDTSAGDDLAVLSVVNDEDVVVDGTKTNGSWKTAPFINLMCENLPVNSYSDVSTDIVENSLDNSKCIASIPRFDYLGNFNVGYNLTYNPTEANIIKLNNAEEINISQLRFRLQQADGQIPLDLSSPMAFVLDIN